MSLLGSGGQGLPAARLLARAVVISRASGAGEATSKHTVMLVGGHPLSAGCGWPASGPCQVGLSLGLSTR